MLETPIDALGFLLGRVLYGSVLGYLAATNLANLDHTVAFAESQGVPRARLAVPIGSLLLLGGAAFVVFGIFPVLGLIAIIAFLVVVTPMMHDFWVHDDPELRQQQLVQFLKNVALLGTAVLLLSLSRWPYSIVGPIV